MSKKQVIFDCDIGCDDAVALIALILSKKVDIIAITCVHGNLSIDEVVQNALKVSNLCDANIPIYRGCSGPLVRRLLKGRDYNTLMQTIKKEVNGEHILIHEKSFDLPLPDYTKQDKHACSYIVETLLNAKEKIDIVAIGPLTNIATALIMEPEIADNIDTIYVMGGGLYIGNRTPLAEANFYDDPEAAEIVLNSKAEVVLCPIEPCEMAATYTKEDIEKIKALNNPISEFIVDNLNGYIQRCNILFNTDANSCCIYDYAAILPLIDETTIIEKRHDIAHVDISGGMADGQLIIDRRNMFTNNNVNIIYQMDKDKAHQILLDVLK